MQLWMLANLKSTGQVNWVETQVKNCSLESKSWKFGQNFYTAVWGRIFFGKISFSLSLFFVKPHFLFLNYSTDWRSPIHIWKNICFTEVFQLYMLITTFTETSRLAFGYITHHHSPDKFTHKIKSHSSFTFWLHKMHVHFIGDIHIFWLWSFLQRKLSK